MKSKPLFSAKVISQAVKAQTVVVPPEHVAIIKDWQAKTAMKAAETNLDGSFITGFLCPLLGYQEINASGAWSIQKNTPVPGGGGNVDVGIGHFKAGAPAELVAPFELKGPKTDDLDAIMPGRGKTPVQQAWDYATYIKGAQWVLVSNMMETRLYAVGYGRQAYERFDLATLHEPEAYARFRLLLGTEGLLGGGTATLLKESEAADKEITDELYKDYKGLRQELVSAIRAKDAALPVTSAITYAQTILDRILFIAFAEDTYLLPKNELKTAFTTENPYVPTTAWQRLTGLFRAVDKGLPGRKIPPYNGGLFREDPAIDGLDIPDALCAKLVNLGGYNFASEVSVNILGHIFEQSITDLEAEKAKAAGLSFDKKKGKVKRDGVVYTPDYITRYIIEQTIGGWLEDRRQELGYGTLPPFDAAKDYPQLEKAKGGGVKVGKLTATAQAHLDFWRAYAEAVARIKVLDPACGSGAFLVTAFDYLREENARAAVEIQRLQGGAAELGTYVPSKVLDNLYGVDLNPEPVEITKLSLWLKTASKEEKLRDLDGNIKRGNSVVADSAVHPDAFDWHAAFPEVMKADGFDVVLGNPPYVRMEVLKPIKSYLEKHFTTATDRADLFIYFYELGLRLLKPQGWLGYISNNTFMKTGSGSKLRTLLAQDATLRRVVDFGDRQIFEGVTTYPAILVMQKGAPTAAHTIPFINVTAAKVDYSTLIATPISFPQADLGTNSWKLEEDGAAQVRRKIIGSHPTLKEVYGDPLYGVKTGLNPAFVIDQAARDSLVKEDPKAAEVIKAFLEGKDIYKWHVRSRKKHIIYIPKNIYNIDDYHSIKTHLAPYRTALEARATKQAWFELQQAQQAYEPQFSKAKIVYSRFLDSAEFTMETMGHYINNALFSLPADYTLLSILNSSVSWFYLQSSGTDLQGGFTQADAEDLAGLPIPQMNASLRDSLANLAKRCQAAAEARYKAEQEVVRRIPDLAPSPPAAKLTKKLQVWHELDFTAFAKEVEKTFKQPIPLKERNQWQTFLDENRAVIEARSAEVAQLEAEIDKQVYALFGLTAEEIATIEAANAKAGS